MLRCAAVEEELFLYKNLQFTEAERHKRVISSNILLPATATRCFSSCVAAGGLVNLSFNSVSFAENSKERSYKSSA